MYGTTYKIESNIMKREIANYIENLIEDGNPLTDIQAQKVAYWEFVDFQQGIITPRDREYNAVIKKLLKGLDL